MTDWASAARVCLLLCALIWISPTAGRALPRRREGDTAARSSSFRGSRHPMPPFRPTSFLTSLTKCGCKGHALHAPAARSMPLYAYNDRRPSRFYRQPLSTQHPMWEEADLTHIFENNRRWVAQHLKDDPDFFQKLKSGQKPEYLYIGCSDSRVPAQEIMGLKAGEVFVTRNIANLVVNTDLSMLSVLEYSVHVLEVKDIFVVGHYGCGGVKAATINKTNGLLDHWLHNIRDVIRLHKTELEVIRDPTEQWNKLVELNVMEQCINLFANPIVQRKQAVDGFPRIHGFVYDIAEGLLRKLDIDFKAEIRKNKDIYRLYDFTAQNPGKVGTEA